MWLAIMTRPDIAAVTSILAQFLANPPPQALEAVNHVYRYLRGTIDLGITYRADQRDELEGSSDSNWSDNNPVDEWSTTGYCYTLAGAPMSRESRKQNTTATSPTEAEYTTQCGAAKEAIYLRQFLNELRRPIIQPTVINADNTGAMALENDLGQHKRSRHIDFPYHYAIEKVADKLSSSTTCRRNK